ncbi:MAG: T9SS type A sorting domain-containing protein [Bacteroidia bacterium]
MKKTKLLILFISLFPSLFSQILVSDIDSGINNSRPSIIGKLNNGIFFFASHKDYGNEPWFSDGTKAGTILLKDIRSGASSSSFASQYVRIGDYYYFIANHSSGFAISLWRTNGTVSGTEMVKDLGVAKIPQGGGTILPLPMIVFKDKLYFIHEDYRGKELWVSDGTSSGTDVLLDIVSGPVGSSPSGLIVYKDHLYFFADNGSVGSELWRTDGSSGGTKLFKDIYSGAISSNTSTYPSLFVFKDMLFFGAQGTHDEGVELYRCDGTPNGTALFKDINTPIQASSYPAFIAATDNYFIFRANTSTDGAEPWVSDGTLSGTKLLKDITSGTGSTYPSQPAVINNKILFSVYNANTGSELWVTDGTDVNTKMLNEINPGTASGFGGQFTQLGSKLYFIGTDMDHGKELWETDGTDNGTKLSLDINPGALGSEISSLIEFEGDLYFNANIASTLFGNELYKFKPQSSSIGNSNKILNLSIFPNPCKTGEVIHVSGINESVDKVQVFSPLGINVCEIQNQNGLLELPDNLSCGLYFLKFNLEHYSYTAKLIIEP